MPGLTVTPRRMRHTSQMSNNCHVYTSKKYWDLVYFILNTTVLSIVLHGPGSLQQALQVAGPVGRLGLVPTSQELPSYEDSRH